LKKLALYKTKVSDAQIAALKEALPALMISR